VTTFGVEELIGRRSKEIPWARPLKPLALLCSCDAVTLAVHMPGDGAINIILIVLVPLPLVGRYRDFLNTVDKQAYDMAVQGFAVLINLGLGINGVALGTSMTYVIYSLTLTIIVLKLFSKLEQRVIE